MQNSEYEILGMSREDFEARNALGYRAWGESGIRDPVEILHQDLWPERIAALSAGADQVIQDITDLQALCGL
jgi:hypothetical protein